MIQNRVEVRVEAYPGNRYVMVRGRRGSWSSWLKGAWNFYLKKSLKNISKKFGILENTRTFGFFFSFFFNLIGHIIK